jgi:glycosyltransferase involved in cell wall biosynthesis
MPYQPRAWTWANRALARYTDTLVVNTLVTREYVIERREMAPERIEVIYNGIDVSRFDLAVDVRAKRIELGLRPDGLVAGIVGRFVEQKDHAGFLRAAKLVSERNPAAQFLCVGRGPTLEATEALANELGIADKVVFAGERSDVPEIMHALDVLVLSSRWEGFPNVLMEAMAASCPVIATRVGGSPELVVDGESGLLVPPEEAPALSSAMLRVLGDKELATALGQGGRHRVESLFSREHMAGETAKLYERLLRKKGEW